MTRKKYQRAAFTVMELLITIAIIGVLAAISVVSFASVRSSARDSTRLTDVNRIAVALEKYYNLHRAYPLCSGGDENVNSGWYTCLAPSLKPFLDPLPSDPAKKNVGYSYHSLINPISKSQAAYLYFPLEKSNPNFSSASFLWYNGQHGFYLYTRIFGLY